MRLSIRPVVLGATGTVLAVFLAAAGSVPAHSDPVQPPTATNGGSLIDDNAYPGAAEILQNQHVTVVAGDGHILVADCATPPSNDIGVIKVYTTEQVGPDGAGMVCFQVTAPHGVLALQVPGVYEIRGDGQRNGTGHPLTAEVKTDDGVHTTQSCDPSGSTQFGVGQDENGDPTTLLTLRVPN